MFRWDNSILEQQQQQQQLSQEHREVSRSSTLDPLIDTGYQLSSLCTCFDQIVSLLLNWPPAVTHKGHTSNQWQIDTS